MPPRYPTGRVEFDSGFDPPHINCNCLRSRDVLLKSLYIGKCSIYAKASPCISA